MKTLVDEDPEENLALNLPDFIKPGAIIYCQAHGVTTLMNVKYHEITAKGLTITTSYGVEKTIKADSIICALLSSENTGFTDSLKEKVTEVYAVGDCSKSGVIVAAIEAGNIVARIAYRKECGMSTLGNFKHKSRELLYKNG